MSIDEVITSPQNSRVQLARGLLEQGKTRRKQNAFVAEGARLIEDGLKSRFPVQFVLYKTNHTARVADLLHALPLAVPAYAVEDKLFYSLADTESSQGILAVFDLVEQPIPENPNFVLILDQLRDPGNLGAILRTAEAAGVQAVCLPPGTTDAWAPKVVRSAMGSHFRLPIFSWEWEVIDAFVEQMSVFHADMVGSLTCWQADFRVPTALLIGGEAEGISEHGKLLAAHIVRIPMAGGTESLNAAMSAGLLMFEVLRQRSMEGA